MNYNPITGNTNRIQIHAVLHQKRRSVFYMKDAPSFKKRRSVSEKKTERLFL